MMERMIPGKFRSLRTVKRRGSMNTNQKRICIAISALIMALIAYPTFQNFVREDMFHTLEHALVFDLPTRGNMAPTVSVSMLLVQWAGILIAGGLTFCFAKSSPMKLNYAKRMGCIAQIAQKLLTLPTSTNEFIFTEMEQAQSKPCAVGVVGRMIHVDVAKGIASDQKEARIQALCEYFSRSGVVKIDDSKFEKYSSNAKKPSFLLFLILLGGCFLHFMLSAKGLLSLEEFQNINSNNHVLTEFITYKSVIIILSMIFITPFLHCTRPKPRPTIFTLKHIVLSVYIGSLIQFLFYFKIGSFPYF